MAYLIFALRGAMGVLLLVAGALKAHDGPVAGTAYVAGYQLLPRMLVAPVGTSLPYIEMVLGAYLLVGFFTRATASVVTAQFVAFAIAVGSLVVRKIPADCGCFGSSIPTPPSWGHVLVDLFLAAIAAMIAWRAPGAFAIERRLFPSGATGVTHEPS